MPQSVLQARGAGGTHFFRKFENNNVTSGMADVPGIRVVMITGDYLLTAIAIAKNATLLESKTCTVVCCAIFKLAAHVEAVETTCLPLPD